MKIGFFCSSSNALPDVYYDLARDFAKALAERDFELVTGGANVGLMRILSETARKLGVKTTGIIPKVIFHKELADHRNDELIITENMAERKQKIIDISDAFIALPGGFGTLDELLEVIVHKQLALLDKPIVIFNYNGFYDPLIRQFDLFIEEKFAKKISRNLYFITDNINAALDYIQNYKQNQSIDQEWFKVNKENF